MPAKRVLNINYEKKLPNPRAIELKSFSKINEGLKTIYKFTYEKAKKGPEITVVEDACGNVDKYYINEKKKIEKIQRHEHKNRSQQLKKTQLYEWGQGKQESFLLSTKLLDENNNQLKVTKNEYDTQQKGNIIKQTIIGNITGKGSNDAYSKEYTYTGANRIKTLTEPNGLQTEYTYLVCQINGMILETDLLLTKFIKYKNEIKQRTFYEYDSDNVLIKEITDDGSSRNVKDLTDVTKRLIKKNIPRCLEPYGLTDTLEEYYLDFNTGKEKLLRKEKYEYTKACQITTKHIYGSDNEYKYTLHYAYDEKNNLIEQTDPLGRTAKYTYDENSNKVYEKTFEGKEIRYEYDLWNRLIKKTINNEKDKYIEEHDYDLKNNKIFQKDIYGNVTRYEYNVFGQVIKEIQPAIEDENGKIVNPTEEYRYDALGNQILKKDPKGNITKASYNIFGKPTQIIYPNNTKENYIYNLDGTLLEHSNQEGTKTLYKYDYLKRVISKKIIPVKESAREETVEYGAFDLLKKIDADSNATKYTYDGAGRKIKEEFFSKNNDLLSVEEIFYDELGFIKKKIKGNSLAITYKRDLLGRVLEKTKEDSNGKILFKKGFIYDNSGEKKTIISYIAENKSEEIQYFDILNRLIKSVDALNNETIIKYPNVNGNLIKEIINPISQRTIITYDAVKREKKIEEKNPLNQTTAKEEKYYDLNGNLSKQTSTIYNLNDFTQRQVTTLWQYDAMNRVIKLTEAVNTKDEKITRYSYTQLGLLEKTVTPNDIEIINQYDGFGDKVRTCSSSKDIDCVFTYDSLGRVIETEDINTNLTVKRVYDAKNNILLEEMSNGLKLINEYDLLNNKVKCILPGGINIEYIYDPLNLRQVIRKDENGSELYRHEFLKYDLSGNLLMEKLIRNAGHIDYKTDLLGRTVSIKTPYHTQNIAYDRIGRIFSITWGGFLEDSSEYKYDDLNQIIEEKTALFNNNYLFDSNYNRLKKNDDIYQINNLNQILTASKDEFIYDKNGNPLQKITKDGETNYFYDALDRLIKIEKPENNILEFTYDPFNRRISKRFIEYSETGLAEKDFRYFLYDDQNEIGSFDQDLNQKELRILSDPQTAEIGSGIAFELGNDIYAPIYDASGNVVSLIKDRSLYQHYRYSVFGERKIYSQNDQIEETQQINNPWQFSSKRMDEESNLIYFGRRYYDPNLGRWLTCDPKGFEEGMNFYVFVLNDPLTKTDLYGLEINEYTDQFSWNKNVLTKLQNDQYNCTQNVNEKPIQGNDDNFVLEVSRETDFYRGLDRVKDLANNMANFSKGVFEVFTGIELAAPSTEKDAYGRILGRNKAKLYGDAMTVLGLAMTTEGTFSSGATPVLALAGGPIGIATAAAPFALIAGGAAAACQGIVMHRNYDKLNRIEISNEKNKIEFKKPKSHISGKEGAKNAPSWAKGNKPYKNESGKDFAKRLMDAKYGRGNYQKDSNPEFNKIKKWGDRAWE